MSTPPKGQTAPRGRHTTRERNPISTHKAIFPDNTGAESKMIVLPGREGTHDHGTPWFQLHLSLKF